MVRDRELLLQLSACHAYSMSAKNATMAIVPCYRKNAAHPEYAQIDLSAATENLLLEAVKSGAGRGLAGHRPGPGSGWIRCGRS